MNEDFKWILAELDDCNREECRAYAKKVTKILAAYTMAVDDSCSSNLIGKIIRRYSDLTGGSV